MEGPEGLESTTLRQRLVLLALIELDHRGSTPANALEVRDCCGDHVDEVASEVLGAPNEVDVTRALNELATADLVAERLREVTATGKGRPGYEPTLDAAEVLDGLADDDRLEPVVSRVREVTSRR